MTMGMEAFAERARRELVATGETVRKRTVETASELTAQEAHIARLAVDGRTSVEIGAQLFLSTRTVEWHLAKVYSKLGVGSRRELRPALAHLQLSARAFGEGLGAHGRECVERRSQLAAGLGPPVLPAQPFAVDQVGAGQVGRHPGAARPGRGSRRDSQARTEAS
jgi:DNA-binding CsgD family transcriptional regulator